MDMISSIQFQSLLGVGLKKAQTYNDDKPVELMSSSGKKVLGFRKGGDGGALTLGGEQISELPVHPQYFSAFTHFLCMGGKY